MKRGKCRYCHEKPVSQTGVARRLDLCRKCACDASIVEGRKRAKAVTKEISAGLPKLYKELRGEADNER